MLFKHLLRGAASAIALTSCAVAGQAFAQDQELEQEDVTRFDELVVTANKREQRLQDVPIVVTVATEQLIEDTGVKDIRDMAILTPGLTVTATSSEASVTARIRGVGTVGDNPGLESSVGVVIDGVYRPRNGVGFGDLGDIQRIEVLKGPQGTLFGKNTSAGVINVLTKEPSFNPGTEIELTAGNYSALGGSLNITGPLKEETLAGSLFFATRQRDGFMKVETLGSGAPSEANDQDYYTLRGQLLALPNERFSARLIGDYSERDESCCAASHVFVGPAANGRGAIMNAIKPGSVDTDNDPFDRVAIANRPYAQRIEDMGVSAELTYDYSDSVDLTSITALRSWRSELGSDADYSGLDIFYIPVDGSNYTEIDQFSQEFRAQGEVGRLNWLAGVFFASEDISNQAVLNYGDDFYEYIDVRLSANLPAALGGRPAGTQHAPGLARIDNHEQEAKTWAIFTNNDFQLTDAATVTLGLRYTSEEKDLTSTFQTFSDSCSNAETTGLNAIPALVAGQCVPFMNDDFDALGVHRQSLDEEEFSGTLKFAYRFTDQIMAYASASRGYKAGGFNLDRESVLCAPDGTPVVTAVPDVQLNQPPSALSPSPLPTHSGCPVANGVLATGRPTNNWVADPDTAFAPEIVEAYEIGAKTQWFGNSLLLNVTGFHQTYTDFQLNTFAGTQFVVVTLPEVVSKGIDADIFWNTPIEGLSIQGGGTIADTIISRFRTSDFPNFADYPPVSHMQDRRLSFAPRYTASLAATYETELSANYIFRANVAAKYNSAYNTGSDLNIVKRQDEFTIVNARLGIGTADDKWRVELWGQNLFDEDAVQVAFNGSFQVTTTAPQFVGQDPGVVNNPTSVYPAFLAPPRTFGVTLRTKM